MNAAIKETLINASIYSCIAFSIVFIALGGLTLVLYAMRLLAGNDTPEKPESDALEPAAAPKANAAPKPSAPGSAAVAEPAARPAEIKTRHVAAITAAILALTQGRGRVLSVAPVGQPLPDTTQRWRATAMVEAVGRRLLPGWKRC